MTSVPPEIEEAARDLARSEFDVSEAEVDALAADSRFALAAYLREEVGEATDTVSPVRGPSILDEDVDGDRDPAAEEVEALRSMYAAFGQLSEATEALADAVLDRDVRTLTFEEMLAETLARRQGGEA